MKNDERFVMGVSMHTGWASLVVAGGSLSAPRVRMREPIAMLDEHERFVFHRAAEAGAASAAAVVERASHAARAAATRAVRDVLARARASGLDVVACAIAAKRAPMPSPLDAILASHARIHTAEGCLYRDTVSAASAAAGLAVHIFDPRELDAGADAALLAAAGKIVGRPWTKDEKRASLAAWRALST
jgi:hypothetical protein